MNASKENAAEAIIKALALDTLIKEDDDEYQKRLDFVVSFLRAAQRKLPSEGSYEAEKARRRSENASGS